MCSLTQVLVYINKTLSGRLREFKNKGKVQLGNPKSGRGLLRERSLRRLFITKFKSQTAQTGFHKGGRNQSWSRTRLVARRALTVERGTKVEIRVSFPNIFIKKASEVL